MVATIFNFYKIYRNEAPSISVIVKIMKKLDKWNVTLTLIASTVSRYMESRCIVEYDPKNGRRQNVHTKSWMDISEKKYRIINARTLDIKSLNTRDDRIQYLKMRDTLGKDNMPDTLDKFQDMKYNNSDKYERLLDKAFIQDKFNKGIWKDKINIEKQKRHIKSTAKKGKNYFYDDVDLEKLYDVNKMTGKFRRKNGTNEHNYELIDLPKNIDIGIDIYSGNSINGFTIHYSKTGSHLIPTYSKREE